MSIKNETGKTAKIFDFCWFRNPKRISKRGQITYFIIAGVVILIIAAFIIYLRGTVVEKETEKEVERVKEQAFSTQQVENYVTDCLRITAENALDLLGRQGGVIYMIDNGEIMLPEDIDEGINFIKHGTCSNISSNPYCRIWNIIDVVGPSLDQGHHNLLNLYRNPPGSAYSVYGAMDESIRRYIEQDTNFGTCFTNGISDLAKQGFEIDDSNAQRKVKFTVAENDVAVNLNYLLKITDKATGKIENIENFKANLNVRLNRIWDFVNDKINHDLRDLNYDIQQSDDGISSLLMQPLLEANGKKVQLVEVTDTKSKLKGEDYKFIFGRANRAPTITSIGDQLVNEGQTLTLTISAVDYDEGTSLTYSASGPSGGNLPDHASFSAGTKTFSWTPKFNQEGTYIIRFSVSDGDATSYEEITITVNNINQVPTANGDDTITVDEDGFVRIELSGVDPDLNQLKYIISELPSNGKLSENGGLPPVGGVTEITFPQDLSGNDVFYNPDPDHAGTDSFTFKVNDGTVDSSIATITITIDEANNDAPVVLDIGDQSIAIGEAFDDIYLNNFVDDPDNSEDEISWTYSGNTDLTVTVSSSRVATVAASSGWTGSETIVFTATDPDGMSHSDDSTFTITTT